MKTSCYAGDCCGAGFTAGSNWLISLLAAHIAPLSTMKVSLQGEGFQVNSSSSPPSPMSEVCFVFSNTVLPPSSVRKPRAMATAYITLEVTLTLCS